MFEFHRSSSVVIVAVLLAACGDQLTQPPSPPDAGFTILDGARGGNAQFFFLPPMVPAPTYSGAFDAAQSPVGRPARPHAPPGSSRAAAA